MWNQCHVVVSSFPFQSVRYMWHAQYIFILYISFLILMDMNLIYMYAVKERRPTSIVFFTAFCCFDNVHMYTLPLLMQLHLMFTFHNANMSRVTITRMLFISVSEQY